MRVIILLACLLLSLGYVHESQSLEEVNWVLVNVFICDSATVVKRPAYNCDACCKHRGYAVGSDDDHLCTCTKESVDRPQVMRVSDEIRIYSPEGNFTVVKQAAYASPALDH